MPGIQGRRPRTNRYAPAADPVGALYTKNSAGLFVPLSGGQGTTGQILTSNGDDAEATFEDAPTGGGGGGGDFFGATGPRSTPPSTGWSWFQQRSSVETISSRDGSIQLSVPLGNAGASTVESARMRTAPSTPYTIIANMEGIMIATNYHNYGLCFGNGGSEIRLFYYGYVDGALNVYIAPTSGGAAGSATFGPWTLRNQLTFFAIRDDGTNKKYYVGVEEENMYEVFSEARTAQFTPTQVGWFAGPRQNSWPVDVTLWSWKEQSAAPA